MITLLTVWGWLLIGAAIGRVAFVRILGDAPRRDRRQTTDNYNRPSVWRDCWSDAFTRALWAGLLCMVAWPVALPVTLMFAHTGAEKLSARRERLEADIARLESATSSEEPS